MKYLIVCILLAGSTCCRAQEMTYRHAASVSYVLLSIGYTKEGNSVPGGLFLDYDYMFNHSARGFWSVQGGPGVFGFRSYYRGYSVHNVVGYNWGKRGKFFQLGFTGTYINEYFDSGGDQLGPHRDQSYILGPQIGYKRIRSKGYYFGTNIGFCMPVFTTYKAPPGPQYGTPYTGSTLTARISFTFGCAFGKRA